MKDSCIFSIEKEMYHLIIIEKEMYHLMYHSNYQLLQMLVLLFTLEIVEL